jgi:hypothetical protein
MINSGDLFHPCRGNYFSFFFFFFFDTVFGSKVRIVYSYEWPVFGHLQSSLHFYSFTTITPAVTGKQLLHQVF